ncbi:MAPK-interacting and spindle-stabilizing protein-like [Rhipicephalus sanguineus]|uniref:MAPK-interacting and spindle-stabilizing protein-like n=1 Tax=Rhipicephalus sanguineus TaxID=34632 RepID=UPI00189500D0|nr:MAPK-interacting and spindle-stabilizing protein-like [Rhipicephalus sanguineus]
MKFLLVIALLGVASAHPGVRRRREAYLLPDGAEILVGSVKTTFKCPGDGYYADMDNDCKVFHVCHDVLGPEGAVGHEMQHFSFLCGNQTVFNQLSLTCAYEEDSVPCQNAKDFYYLNANIGDPTAEFLSDNDIQRAVPLVPTLQAHAAAAALTAGPAQGPAGPAPGPSGPLRAPPTPGPSGPLRGPPATGPSGTLRAPLAPGQSGPLRAPPAGPQGRTPARGLGRGAAASEVQEVTVTAPPTTTAPAPSTTLKEE